MNGYLLDTNVISEVVRPRPEPKVTNWIISTDEDLLYLSVLTLGEIRKGVTAMPGLTRRNAVERWMTDDLMLRFSGRILGVDLSIADTWGKLAGSAAARKSPLPVIDGLLAATAFENGLTLVSRDTWHFARIGVPVLNPWED